MRCRFAERLLYLYREGELSPRQQDRLRRHLEGCPGCVERAAAIERLRSHIEVVRETKPRLTGAEELTGTIMTGLTYMERERRTRSFRTGQPLWGGTVYSILRPALAVAALILAITLIGQELLILNRISRLEERVTLAQDTRVERDRLAQSMDLVRDIERLYGVSEVLGGLDSERLGEPDLVVIRKSDLYSLLSRYGVPGTGSEAVARSIQSTLPVLNGISLEDGLSRAELWTLFEYRMEIIDALRRM